MSEYFQPDPGLLDLFFRPAKFISVFFYLTVAPVGVGCTKATHANPLIARVTA